MTRNDISEKSKSFCIILAIIGNLFLLGGLHRFYTKKYISGLIMFFTLGGFAIWTAIDVLLLFCNLFKDGNRKTVRVWVL